MDFDLATVQSQLENWRDQIWLWMQTPSFLAQLSAIVLSILIAPLLAKILQRAIPFFRNAPAETVKYLKVRQVLYKIGGLLRAVLLVLLLGLSSNILLAVPAFSEDWLVKLAQSLAAVFLVYRVIKVFLTDAFYRKLALWVLVPLSLIIVLGYFDELKALLSGTVLLPMGNNPITAMTVVKLVVFGFLFFWVGNLSNVKGQSAIRSQENLDAGVREIVAKLFQIVLFVIIFFLVVGAAGIPLSGLVVVFSALGLGIGFGLQPIAANFISGLIILFDRSVKIGYYVNMEGEMFGRVKAINIRSTTVATADGKDIIVPNTKFTEDAYENWTHDNPLQRYEVDFGVAYDTDLDALVPLIRDAVLEHEDVLSDPDVPSVEFRSFGDSAINMCVEFWAEGIDDGPNKFTSDVGMIIWRTLKANNIEIPFPQRVVKNIK